MWRDDGADGDGQKSMNKSIWKNRHLCVYVCWWASERFSLMYRQRRNQRGRKERVLRKWKKMNKVKVWMKKPKRDDQVANQNWQRNCSCNRFAQLSGAGVQKSSFSSRPPRHTHAHSEMLSAIRPKRLCTNTQSNRNPHSTVATLDNRPLELIFWLHSTN